MTQKMAALILLLLIMTVVSISGKCVQCELSHQLGKDEQLRKGDYLLSENGNFKAIFQRNMMTQTMAILLLFLVVMIAVPVLGRCPPPDNEIRYQKFLRQHYHRGGMSVKDCNTAMSQRCLNKPCKDMNSFILDATTNQIQDVCDKAGTPLGEGDLRQSTQPFQVVTCKHSGGSSRPPCQYKGSKSTRYIVIVCDADKFPVHFEEGIIPE